MQFNGSRFGSLAMLLVLLVAWSGSSVQAQSWRSALRDADELYDAAEDLHDRAERSNDLQAMAATAQLEQLTTDLYQLLRRNACASEVVAMMSATGAALEETSAIVSLNCHLRADRRAQTELANAQRYFNATFEHVQYVLQASGIRPYRAPTSPVLVPSSMVPSSMVPSSLMSPVPSWYQAQPGITVSHGGYEVHYNPAPYGRALPRVRISSVR